MIRYLTSVLKNCGKLSYSFYLIHVYRDYTIITATCLKYCNTCDNVVAKPLSGAQFASVDHPPPCELLHACSALVMICRSGLNITNYTHIVATQSVLLLLLF